MTDKSIEKTYTIPLELEEYAEEIDKILDVENITNFVYVLPSYRKKIVKHFTTVTPGLQAFLKAEPAPGYTPSTTDHKIRYSFWMEYDRVSGKSGKMDIYRIWGDICSDVHFWSTMNNPNKFFFIISPPGRYQKSIEACLVRASERLFDIIELPIMDEKGKPNSQIANLVLKAYVLLDLKVNGPMKQRHEHTFKVDKGAGNEIELTDSEKNKIEASVARELLQLEKPAPIINERDIIALEDEIIEVRLKNEPRNF